MCLTFLGILTQICFASAPRLEKEVWVIVIHSSSWCCFNIYVVYSVSLLYPSELSRKDDVLQFTLFTQHFLLFVLLFIKFGM